MLLKQNLHTKNTQFNSVRLDNEEGDNSIQYAGLNM
jgi:hypothetical protein